MLSVAFVCQLVVVMRRRIARSYPDWKIHTQTNRQHRGKTAQMALSHVIIFPELPEVCIREFGGEKLD